MSALFRIIQSDENFDQLGEGNLKARGDKIRRGTKFGGGDQNPSNGGGGLAFVGSVGDRKVALFFTAVLPLSIKIVLIISLSTDTFSHMGKMPRSSSI